MSSPIDAAVSAWSEDACQAEGLDQLDELATQRLIRLPQVIARVGLKRTAIYQRMRQGTFPSSRSLGPRCTVWVESEIDEWVKSVINGQG